MLLLFLAPQTRWNGTTAILSTNGTDHTASATQRIVREPLLRLMVVVLVIPFLLTVNNKSLLFFDEIASKP